MAKAIPMTPRFNPIAKINEKINLPKTVEAMETTIVYLTSPAARSPFDNGPENGKATVLKTL